MKTSRGRPLGSTYIWNGGPPAWLIWLVKPDAAPAMTPSSGVGTGRVVCGGRFAANSTRRRKIPKTMEIRPTASATAALGT